MAQNDGEALVAGVTGQFADSVQSAEIDFNEATGEFIVTARFGMGHMAYGRCVGDQPGAELVDAVRRQPRQARHAEARRQQ